MLELINVRAGYGREEVIRDVCLTVRAGEIVGLVGINGAGKSTLLQCCSGHLPYWGGTVTWRGGPLAAGDPWTRSRAGISYLAQDQAFFPHLTVAEHVRVAAVCSRRPIEECEAEMADWMPALHDTAHARAGSLSGGEVRALSLGLLFTSRPKLLLLDEPSIGLDRVACARMLERLKSAVRRDGLAILMAEQDIDGISAVADRVHVLRAGMVAASLDAGSLSVETILRWF